MSINLIRKRSNGILTLLPLRTYSCSYISTSYIKRYDVAVVGGGIVGAATGREILMRHPKCKLAIVEKENDFALHQSGNNSGVIHAGIYYKPGSLKAKLCVQGLDLMYKYCEDNKIPHTKSGKLIVATNDLEIGRLNDLYERGKQNGVKDLQMVDSKQIKEIEPLCQGILGLWSPHTGIADYGLVTKHFVKDIVDGGGTSYLNFEVSHFGPSLDPNYPVIIKSKNNEVIAAKYVLTCCGLQSDRVAMLSGCSADPMIVPFRGEYLYLKTGKINLAKVNIYPVPDPKFPFLGTHITPTTDGRIILGPNAIIAFAREGYGWGKINWGDLREVFSFPGFRALGMKYFTYGLAEMMKSLITSLRVKDINKFVKEINVNDVQKGPAGVRAQAMMADGTLVDDFVFDSSSDYCGIGERILHVRNAPSPGATSSIAIAMMIVDKMEKQFLKK